MNFIIKAIYNCNLDCIYCYEKEHNKLLKQMSLDEVHVIFERIYDYYKNKPNNAFYFIWHGGEPLLLGVDYFKSVLDFQKKIFGSKFEWRNSLQSNLFRLDNKIIEFFRENSEKFDLGVSYDLFGKERVMRDGRLSNRIVYKNMNKLYKAGIPFGILCVLTKSNINQIDKIYRFIKYNNITVSFLPLKLLGKEQNDVRPTAEEYADALSRLIEMWLTDRGCLGVIQNAMNIIMKILGYESRSICEYYSNCQKYNITIDPGGDVFACACGSSVQESKYGNILNESLGEIFRSHTRKIWFSRAQKIHGHICKDCAVKNYCNGGCPARALDANKSIFSKDPLCESHYKLFNMIKRFLEVEGFIDRKGQATKKAIKTFSLNEK